MGYSDHRRDNDYRGDSYHMGECDHRGDSDFNHLNIFLMEPCKTCVRKYINYITVYYKTFVLLLGNFVRNNLI